MMTVTSNGSAKPFFPAPFSSEKLASAAWQAYRQAAAAMDRDPLPQHVQESDVFPSGDLSWIDPLELLYDGVNAEGIPLIPQPFPPIFRRAQKLGEDIPVYLTEATLNIIRDRQRFICSISEYAQSALENRINYVLGTGLVYRVEPERAGVPSQEVRNAQRLIDLFGEYNAIELREAEALLRLDIEGEAFLRLFPQNDGMMKVRFVEPELVRSPEGDGTPGRSFGIETDPRDVEDIRGYWIVDNPQAGYTPELVPSDEVVHIKANNYLSAKRGRPLFYQCETNLRRVTQIMNSLSSMARARAKIALIRRLKGIAPLGAQQLAAQVNTTTMQDPITGKQRNIEQFRDGTIITASDRIDYEYPDAQVNAQEFIDVMYADLKGIAARVVMPEWMLTSNTENMAAYTASLVAEAPSTKQFQRLQRNFRGAFGEYRIGPRRSLLCRFMWHCADCGYLSHEWLPWLKIVVKAPTLVSRNKGEEANVNKTYNELGVKSIETIQQEQDLDPEVERQRLERESQRKAARQQQQQQKSPSPSSDQDSSAPQKFGEAQAVTEGRLVELIRDALTRVWESDTGPKIDARGHKYRIVDGKHVPVNPRKQSQPRSGQHQQPEQRTGPYHTEVQQRLDKNPRASIQQKLEHALKARDEVVKSGRRAGTAEHAEAITHILMGPGAELNPQRKKGFDHLQRFQVKHSKAQVTFVNDSKTAATSKDGRSFKFADKSHEQLSKIAQYFTLTRSGQSAFPGYTVHTKEGIFQVIGFPPKQLTTVLTGGQARRTQTNTLQAVDMATFIQHMKDRPATSRENLPVVKLMSWSEATHGSELDSKLRGIHLEQPRNLHAAEAIQQRVKQIVGEHMDKLKPTFDQQADTALSAHNRKSLKISPKNYARIAAESDEASIELLVVRGKTEEEARAILGIEKPKPAKPKKK